MDRLKNKIAISTIDIAKLTQIVMVVLLFFVIYQIAKITWLVVEPAVVTPSTWRLPQSTNQNVTNARIDFSTYQWFGRSTDNAKTDSVKPQEVTQAPKTQLNLTLSGLVASDIISNSMAIVEYQGKQDTYGVDDKIKGTRAVIHEIHHDRLILKNSGKYETLMLDGFDYKTPEAVPKKSSVKTSRVDKRFSSRLAKTRTEILKNPGKITDYISITPIRGEGAKLLGYRLNPGRDPSLFKESGLQKNDIATSINGYDLTNFSESVKVMNELKDMTDISITVERDGQLIEIQFALP